MIETKPATYDVGGVLLERPFKIRRIGHFGLNAMRMEECLRFYTEDLGLRVSDRKDMGERAERPEDIAAFGDPGGYFMRYGTDHHSFVLFNKRVREATDKLRTFAPGVVVNQISWQVGSLAEVVNGRDWLSEDGLKIQRSGRDMPGSNWHTYFYDPDGHTNELFYGMEQIGWDARSKPVPTWDEFIFREAPPLPQIPEDEELRLAAQHGEDLNAGSANRDALTGASYDVDGVLLTRPFKIVKGGPLSLFVKDMDAAVAFYTHKLGLTISEETVWDGRRCVFLRANTEHHTIALYPVELRASLGLRADSTTLAFGFQLGTYRQLRDARAFLAQRGARFVELPAALHPGIDYALHVLDPDGQAVQLYFSMEQIGWDGKPRPASARPNPAPNAWPETIPAQSDTYGGETLMGPLA
jgi:catechol 2,3-dioxygenase-like lactoylglutathione lyase family enzyme